VRLPPLYAIVDAELCAARGLDPVALATTWLAAGVRLIQLRAKTLPTAVVVPLARRIASAARQAGALCLVNDRADVAVAAGAGGVHVGQEDLAPADVRLVAGTGLVVGLSTHSAAQLEAAFALPIDYVAVGPVFGTGTKDTGYAPVGLALVRHAAALAAPTGVPVVAIGGITLATAADVLAAGAAAVAVISDLLVAADPGDRVRAYEERLGRV
jgi:thiamine-phosphate diphosphorylase